MPGASGVVQAVGGNGAWNAISTAQDIAIEQNGYLLVYLSTQVTTDVYFDNLNIKFKSGNLLEETHYYPFGLPIHNLGSAANQQTENRLKYQSNEYIEDNDLRWMNFNARQYDPQIGRFLSIDPLAYVGGQQVHSPYAAMGNNPGMMIDPNGTRSKYALDDLTNVELMEAKRGDILGTGFSSTNVGGLKVSLGMNNTMLEYAGGGGFNVGSNVFSNFGKVVRKFFSKFGNKASSNVEPSTGNKATAKDEENDNSEDQTNDGGQKNYYGDPLFVSKYYNGNPDKPVGRMSLSQASKWFHIGKGEGVYIDFTTIVLPKWVTVERFKNPDYKVNGVPVFYVKFDHPSGFVNPNQALVYGGINLALIDENTVWALPDTYDFDVGEQKNATFGRDAATMIGGGVNGFGWTTEPQGFDIYFIGYQTIPHK